MKKVISIILAMVFLLMNFTNTSAAMLKDRTPPAVIASTPYPQQMNIPFDRLLQVSFNENILKGAAFTRITLASGGKTIPTAISVSKNILLVTPTAKLPYAADCTLTIPAAAVKDCSGNALAKPYMVKFKTMAALLPLTEELKQVFAGENKLSVANPGPLVLSGKEWLPIAAVQYTPPREVFMAARKYGYGRILALGKDDILNNENICTLDNLKFFRNAFTWLNSVNGKRVGFSVGHGEFIDDNALSTLKKELAKDKFIFSPTALTPEALKNKDILIIGNAWKALSKAEINAVESYVANGGSLILAGLGWSYAVYNPKSVYPMDTLSAVFGLKWSVYVISDTVEKYHDAPVFNLSLRNQKPQDKELQQAMDFIKNKTAEHSNDLIELLEKDEKFRTEYVNAHLILASKVTQLSKEQEFRQDIYEFCKSIVKLYPQYFSKKPTFDNRKQPTITWLRERFINTFISSMELTKQRKIEIATLCGFEGHYLNIWNVSSIYIADNNGLDDGQKQFLCDLFGMIPVGLHNIRVVGVENLLQADLKDVPYLAFAFSGSNGAFISTTPGGDLTSTVIMGTNSGINITDLRISAALENSFPERISPRITSIFCASTAHEINHIIDFYTISNNPVLARRQDALLKAAGNHADNYLRSMFGDDFFVRYPHEFFASIANSWFTDSANTLILGLKDFDRGVKQPINQALFFAEVYSQGGSSTYFYSCDASGKLSRVTAPLTRDEKDRINSLTFDGYRYDFVLDETGDVTGYTSTKI